MSQIQTITLRCPDPEALRGFFCNILGMSPRDDGSVGYTPAEAGLLFEKAVGAYRPAKTDLYWKIALSVPNIELACAQLIKAGVSVRGPKQFEDVGYLAHFEDPQGFTIELIEHWFKGNRPDTPVDETRLGGGAVLNLLTLRSSDIEAMRPSLQRWGMVPLCIQPLPAYGFTLHFFACTEDRPPNPDLSAVENREWLYQRPYTVLEFQELHGADQILRPTPTKPGFAGATLTGLSEGLDYDALCITGKCQAPGDAPDM